MVVGEGWRRSGGVSFTNGMSGGMKTSCCRVKSLSLKLYTGTRKPLTHLVPWTLSL